MGERVYYYVMTEGAKLVKTKASNHLAATENAALFAGALSPDEVLLH